MGNFPAVSSVTRYGASPGSLREEFPHNFPAQHATVRHRYEVTSCVRNGTVTRQLKARADLLDFGVFRGGGGLRWALMLMMGWSVFAYPLDKNYCENDSLRIFFGIFEGFGTLKILGKEYFFEELCVKFVAFAK